jgi:2-polyprenyl-3-methyl-5-hydroxy-6-metoxy-1,4-benzoquinol methylase
VAEDYDRVRPGYPALLIDAACAIGSLSPGSRVVEVGCGTGKLTGALVERGLRVEAVDPGRDLIEVARRRVGRSSARFHIARFEDAQLPDGAFDAVFSATAFHWVDPAVGWSKAAHLLRPGGVMALLT